MQSTAADPCWIENGRSVDRSCGFFANGIPKLESLAADREAVLTSIPDDDSDPIVSHLRPQVRTKPAVVPLMPLAGVVSLRAGGLMVSIGSRWISQARTRCGRR